MTHAFGPFDAVIFDMDGTLLDTESMFMSVVYDVVADLGYEMTQTLHGAMVGAAHETTRRLLEDAFGAGFPYALFDARCRARMTESSHEAVPVKLGAAGLLEALRAKQIPAAVATSSYRRSALHHLGRSGLIEMFETIVTRDDVTHPKPHPEPYLTAARRLAVDPGRCIAFEDSHTGVRAAHAAGMQTIMVPDLMHPTDEIAELCVAVMESLDHAHKQIFVVA